MIFLFNFNYVVKWMSDIYKVEMTNKNKTEKILKLVGNQSDMKRNLSGNKTKINEKNMV